MNKQDTLNSLQQYTPFDEDDAVFLTQTIEFVQKNDDFWQRTNLDGHLTGSAWVVSHSRSKVLLIHHLKLEKWFQPGGHADDTDDSLQETARREAIEECGLQILTLEQEGIFDIDIHPIPAKGDVPAHLHYDIRYLFSTPEEVTAFDPSEIKGMQWMDLESLKSPEISASLRRMALKVDQQ
jgi:8-oxo-dGTP pyrophosphatase MutT (NUDIX family)